MKRLYQTLIIPIHSEIARVSTRNNNTALNKLRVWIISFVFQASSCVRMDQLLLVGCRWEVLRVAYTNSFCATIKPTALTAKQYQTNLDAIPVSSYTFIVLVLKFFFVFLNQLFHHLSMIISYTILLIHTFFYFFFYFKLFQVIKRFLLLLPNPTTYLCRLLSSIPVVSCTRFKSIVNRFSHLLRGVFYLV